jgi:RNA polymerase sigma-70 factor (ECF subfamily)
MTDASDARTSVSLLGRLSQDPTDQLAWSEFVDRYGAKIYGWCRRWHLQDADAKDVTQAVLATLCIKIRTFSYDPNLSFRGWLRTLTHHTWSDLVARRRPSLAGGGVGESETGLLESLQARDDLLERLDEQFDYELLEEASARVRVRVEPHTWEAFRLTAIEGMSGALVADRLGLQVATVFKAKSKVQRMLREQIARLESSERKRNWREREADGVADDQDMSLA